MRRSRRIDDATTDVARMQLSGWVRLLIGNLVVFSAVAISTPKSLPAFAYLVPGMISGFFWYSGWVLLSCAHEQRYGKEAWWDIHRLF